jgi:hypothetical protein
MAETAVEQIVPISGHFTSFYCYATAIATSRTLTLRKNEGPTTLTCPIAANATRGSTTGASISFNAGDRIDVSVGNIGTSPSNDTVYSAAIGFGP